MAKIVHFIVDSLVVIPTVITLLSVYLGIKLSKDQPHKVWWGIIVALGVAYSVYAGVSQEAHKQEIKQQRQAMDAVTRVFPEIRSYMRKEYEVKVQSNNQLRDFTANVVKRMRDLSYKHKQIRDQESAKDWALIRENRNDLQKAAEIWNQETEEIVQEHTNLEYEFKTNILGDAIYARDELLSRIANPPQQSADLSAAAFRGFLAGADPVGEAANYLERLAKQLSP